MILEMNAQEDLYEDVDNYANNLFLNTNSSNNNVSLNIDSTPVQPKSEYLNLTDADSLKLMELLTDWGMPFLHTTCIGKKCINCSF